MVEGPPLEGASGAPPVAMQGAGRGTAISAPGSQHRSSKATEQLSTPTPGKANPPSGVTPGRGNVGTVPTTPGQAPGSNRLPRGGRLKLPPRVQVHPFREPQENASPALSPEQDYLQLA